MAEYPVTLFAAIPIDGMLGGTAWCPGYDEKESDDIQYEGGMWYLVNRSVDEGGGQLWKSKCAFKSTIAWTDFSSTIFILVFLIGLSKYQKDKAEKADMSVQTAQDYSIEVEDPGDYDYEPDKWKDFFEQFGDVMAVTVAVKNGPLMKKLVERKVLLRSLRFAGWHIRSDDDFKSDEIRIALRKGDNEAAADLIKPETEETDAEHYIKAVPGGIKGFLEKIGAKKDVDFFCRALLKVNREIDVEIKKITESDTGRGIPARVYVTFDSEKAQRQCLKIMSVGSFWAYWDTPAPWDRCQCLLNCLNAIPGVNVKDEVPKKYKSLAGHPDKGADTYENLLRVVLAPEPEDICYENLDIEPIDLQKKSVIMNFVATLVVIAVATGVILLFATDEQTGLGLGALSIAAANGGLPVVMKAINSYEPHPTETAQQQSYLFKLVTARWIISGFVVYSQTYWIDTTSGTNIKKIITVLLADMTLTPLLQILDIPGNVKRYLVAPWEKTQDGMNCRFDGKPWQLAERFSTVTKSIFLCLFFSSLVPLGYLMCATTLFITYWVDKYCMLRQWKQMPPLDASIVALAREQLAYAVLVHCIITLHYFAGWPFDEAGACLEDCDTTHPQYNYAEKNLWNKGKFIIFSKYDWMSPDQQNTVRAYQFLTVVMVITISFGYFGGTVYKMLFSTFVGEEEQDGEPVKRPGQDDKDNPLYIPGKEDELILASEADVDVSAYIPNILSPNFAQTQLAVNLPDCLKVASKGATFVPSQKGEDITASNFPASMNAWENNEDLGINFDMNTLCSDEFFQSRPDDLTKCFGVCKVYKKDQDEEAAAAASKRFQGSVFTSSNPMGGETPSSPAGAHWLGSDGIPEGEVQVATPRADDGPPAEESAAGEPAGEEPAPEVPDQTVSMPPAPPTEEEEGAPPAENDDKDGGDDKTLL